MSFFLLKLTLLATHHPSFNSAHTTSDLCASWKHQIRILLSRVGQIHYGLWKCWGCGTDCHCGHRRWQFCHQAKNFRRGSHHEPSVEGHRTQRSVPYSMMCAKLHTLYFPTTIESSGKRCNYLTLYSFFLFSWIYTSDFQSGIKSQDEEPQHDWCRCFLALDLAECYSPCYCHIGVPLVYRRWCGSRQSIWP